MKPIKKYRITGNVPGIIQGRTLSNPVIEFEGASVNPDQTMTVFIKYSEQNCNCDIVRPYEESVPVMDFDDYILNHPNHIGIAEI